MSRMETSNRILELYSGIGGMHCAWNESKLPGEIVAAVDINTVANEVYRHNFPNTKLFTKNIQSISPRQIKELHVNTILMSPPCQPFSRNGNFLDLNDPRTNSFLYILQILDQLPDVEYILLENVKGFECSMVRNMFIDKLMECNFIYQEFLLCPLSFGIQNARLRYYCLARRTKSMWNFKRKDEIITTLEKIYEKLQTIEHIIEPSVDDKYLIPDKILKRANIMDICYKTSEKTCCFTKAYTHYAEGTGSVFSEADPEQVKECFDRANAFENGSPDFVKTIKDLQLRYFTPQEVLRLMAFPKYYSFPEPITMKQCFRLLGNSVNVKVISELLKLLFD